MLCIFFSHHINFFCMTLTENKEQHDDDVEMYKVL